jgi:Glycosyl hydrolase family 26
VTARRRTHRVSIIAAVTALVAATVATVATVLASGGGAPHSQPSPRQTAAAASAAPAVPARGAYVGAWVQPASYTQPGYVSAVDTLQRQIGRRLDIVHTYLRQPATFPTSSDLAFVRQGSMLLVSWALNGSRAIMSGRDDQAIRQRAAELRSIGKPVFLEWRWEMDRPNLRSLVGSPADYIAAWKHIRRIFAAEHATNVAWVWCPTANGFARGDAAAYYPGDAEVDWLCADAYPGSGPQRSFDQVTQPFLAWAASHPKPIIIGEFGVPLSYGTQMRTQWLQAAGATVKAHPQIKALLYFDSNTDGTKPQTSFALSGSPLGAFRKITDQHYFNPRGLPLT